MAHRRDSALARRFSAPSTRCRATLTLRRHYSCRCAHFHRRTHRTPRYATHDALHATSPHCTFSTQHALTHAPSTAPHAVSLSLPAGKRRTGSHCMREETHHYLYAPCCYARITTHSTTHAHISCICAPRRLPGAHTLLCRGGV